MVMMYPVYGLQRSGIYLLSKLLKYEIINGYSIIVYNSHNDSSKQNVISEYLDEGIGGVTELFKNRVVRSVRRQLQPLSGMLFIMNSFTPF